MNFQSFIEHFADAINKKENTILDSSTNFWELDEWSSLSALSVVSMIDEEYGVSLKSADIKAVQTIKDLFEIVESKQH